VLDKLVKRGRNAVVQTGHQLGSKEKQTFLKLA